MFLVVWIIFGVVFFILEFFIFELKFVIIVFFWFFGVVVGFVSFFRSV